MMVPLMDPIPEPCRQTPLIVLLCLVPAPKCRVQPRAGSLKAPPLVNRPPTLLSTLSL